MWQAEHGWQSLGDMVDKFFQQTRSQDETINLARERWISDILPNADIRKAFEESLSRWQLVSHRMLMQWYLMSSPDIIRNADKPSPPSGIENEPITYYVALSRLWTTEFRQMGDHEAEFQRLMLQNTREFARTHARCQKFARHSFRKVTFNSPNFESPERSEFELPFVPDIDPCPWLDVENRNNSLPFYLWDIKSERTREVTDIVAEIGGNPQYAAISHTWGRWETPGECSLPGVPWKIPLNSRFDVFQLPKILQALPYQYVWIDLLTIPQLVTCPKLAALTRQEIARQAQIFQSASIAIAWLNDVKTWQGVEDAIAWLCFHYFMQSEFEAKEDFNKYWNLWTVEMELYQPTNNASGLEPNAWFTSLWTLQELCLRPDMLLCNEKWQFIKTPGELPLSMSDLVALQEPIKYYLKEGVYTPKCVYLLKKLITETGLENLLDLSPAEIIHMGNRRQCTGQRAEAIMSVVGAIDWFRVEDDGQNNYIRGQYPIAFVNEVRERIGSAVFFCSRPDDSPRFHEILDKICSYDDAYLSGLTSLGSLLPFGEGIMPISDVESNDIAIPEHPTVRSWILESTGSVRIKEALVMTSAGDSGCFLIGPFPSSGWRKIESKLNTDFDEWLNTYVPSMTNYAVVLFKSRWLARGIVLKEIRSGVLIKVATFWMRTSDSKLELVQKEWLVL